MGIINVLEKFGEVVFVGSYYLNLMTVRDIDIDLVSTNISNDDHLKIAKHFLAQKYNTSVILVDDRLYTTENRPVSIYIGAKQIYKGKKWKLDIRYLQEENVTTETQNDLWLEKLNPENREVILKIKTELDDEIHNQKKITSSDIYDAVLFDDIKTSDDFLSHFNTK